MDPHCPEALEYLEVFGFPVLVYVEPKVAEVHHFSRGSFHDISHGVGDGVPHREEFRGEMLGNFYLLAVFYRLDAEFWDVREFFVAFLDHRFRDVRRINWGIPELLDEIVDRRNVVVVAVREDDPPDILLFPLKVRDIRDDVVHSRRVFFGELDSHVGDDDIIFILKERAVPADLLEPAQRNEPKLGFASTLGQYFPRRSCPVFDDFRPWSGLLCFSYHCY